MRIEVAKQRCMDNGMINNKNLLAGSLKVLLIMLSLGALLTGCAGNSRPAETVAADSRGTETKQAFVEVTPNYEALDPLYGLGSMGSFDAGLAAFSEQQYSQALLQWYPLARDKDPRAEYYLGFMYVNGLGLPRDPGEGSLWLIRSAQRGYSDAQYELGKLYLVGLGVDENMDQAMRWLMAAARAGQPAAQFNVGLLYQQDRVPLSSNLLAVYQGTRSKDFNFQQAARWYQVAAEQGHAAAQNNLGWLYLHGHGVSRDPAVAFRWFSASADQGVIDACYNLGLLYEQGEGTTLDLQKALFWQSKAADYGYGPARQRLPELRRQIEFFDQSLVLFGTPLALTTREVMREKLSQNKALVIREASNYWFDIYESSRTLQGTDRLFAGYSLRTGKLASLEYRFPSFNDPNLVLKVIDMITAKYGRPVSSQGEIGRGVVDYAWEVKDTRIQVRRYWPDTTVFLSYQVGDSYTTMIGEMPPNAKELIYNLEVETY
jgi:TPR repeat protein